MLKILEDLNDSLTNQLNVSLSNYHLFYFLLFCLITLLEFNFIELKYFLERK